MLRGTPLALLVTLCASCQRPPAEPAPPTSPADAPLVIVESEPNPTPEPTPSRVGPRLPDAQLVALYACWFEHPYEYMFEPATASGRPLPINGLAAGQFMAGVSGIMDYGSLSRCAERITGVKKSSYSAIEPIEALSGISPIREDVHADGYKPGRFNRYDAEIIRWGASALVPDPHLEIVDGWTAQQLYRAGFSRFFRLMTHSYVDLLGRDALNPDRDRYLAATMAGQDGIEWLHTHYGGRLPEYGGFYDGTQMTAGMAYGFWLRRSDDGTADALWAGLRDFMQVYDGAWFAELIARYPGVG